MSGSGGGGYGGGGRAAGFSDCNIIETVPLNSVQSAVLPSLTVGSELEVVLANQGKSLVAQVPSGAIAGALTPNALADLLECIGKGRHYKAIVLKKKGALVEVEIRPR